MVCLSCGYMLELSSVVLRDETPECKQITYCCRNCRAVLFARIMLTRPSPLPPEELKRRSNGVGSHAR